MIALVSIYLMTLMQTPLSHSSQKLTKRDGKNTPSLTPVSAFAPAQESGEVYAAAVSEHKQPLDISFYRG